MSDATPPEKPDAKTLMELQRELEALRSFSLLIHQPHELLPIYQALFQTASSVMPADASFIAVLNDEGYLKTVFSFDDGTEFTKPNAQPWRPSPFGPTAWVIDRGEPLLFDDFNVELPTRLPQAHIDPFGEDEKLSRSWMAVPMLIGDQVKGLVNVQSYEAARYGPREEQLLTTLASMLAIAIEHRRLRSDLERWYEALAAPLIPAADDLLIAPLIGRLDEERLALLQSSLLHAIERQGVRAVLLDLTGISDLDAEGAARLARVCRATLLLGARCALSGVPSELAARMAALQLAAVPTVRTVEQGLALLRRMVDAERGHR